MGVPTFTPDTEREIYEPIPIQDTFATHIHHVEVVGCMLRFWFTVQEEGRHRLVDKLLVPAENLACMIRKSERALQGRQELENPSIHVN